MRVVVIEDEVLAAEDFIQTLSQVDTEIEVVAHFKSVKECLVKLQLVQDVDLIFSDIQLGDGLSFQIYEQIKIDAPVIFCTAFDDYFLDAFKNNGIDYLLKPISKVAVEETLQKYYKLQRQLSKRMINRKEIFPVSSLVHHKPSSIIVYQQDRIIPLATDLIALCYIEFENVFIQTFDNREYVVNKSLDDLEKILSFDFFRANRQHLIARKALRHASYTLSRKLHLELTVSCKNRIHVSREKSAVFLKWLEGG